MSGSYFTDPDDLHRIFMREFDGSDHWFDIPAIQPEAERLAIQDVIVNYKTIRAIGGGTNRQQRRQQATTEYAEMNMRGQFFILLQRTVKAWSFTDRASNPMPITNQSIARLGPAGAYMARKINDYYEAQRWTEDEEKNSESASSTGTEALDLSPESFSTSTSPNGSADSTLITSGY